VPKGTAIPFGSFGSSGIGHIFLYADKVSQAMNLDLTTINRLSGGKVGTHDVCCPLCGSCNLPAERS
jgi:hypothetical protein